MKRIGNAFCICANCNQPFLNRMLLVHNKSAKFWDAGGKGHKFCAGKCYDQYRNHKNRKLVTCIVCKKTWYTISRGKVRYCNKCKCMISVKKRNQDKMNQDSILRCLDKRFRPGRLFCTKCKVWKKPASFSKSKQNFLKLDSNCRKCKKEYYDKFIKNPKNKCLKNKKQRERNKQNTEQLKATFYRLSRLEERNKNEKKSKGK